jgi:hypothetical protein
MVSALLLVLGSGCRTQIGYEPFPYSTHGEALDVIERTLRGQHGHFAPVEVEVTEAHLAILRNKTNIWSGTTALHPTVVAYASIGEITLAKHRRWFAVTLWRVNHTALLRIYAPTLQSAQRFADAIETFRRFAALSVFN